MTRPELPAFDREPGDTKWPQAAEPTVPSRAPLAGAGAAPDDILDDLADEDPAAASPEPQPPPPPPPPPPAPVALPIAWLVETGSPPIRYRALLDLARIAPAPERLPALVYSYPPAVALALMQRPEGTWHNAMLAVPPARSLGFDGVGTIVAYRRLLEYAWERDAPPLFHARRVLFRLLAEDNDPGLLYELGEKGKGDEEFVRQQRGLLREAAAAALAQAGYESDPRLRGAAYRVLQRVVAFMRSPLAEDPWTGSSSKRTLAAGATPPSYFFLLMLSFMPLFRLEHAGEMDQLLAYLTRRSDDKAAAMPRALVTGNPLADDEALDNDVPFAVAWLELTARLGFLKRFDGWGAAFDRLLEQCDDDGIWRMRRGQNSARTHHPFVWPAYPLMPSASSDEMSADITFRLGLIARYAGRPLEFV